MAGQYDLINEFLENNRTNISIIDVCFDLNFVAFIGALNIIFYKQSLLQMTTCVLVQCKL